MAKSSVEKNKSADSSGAAPAPVKVPVKEQIPNAPKRKADGSAHMVRDLLIATVILGAGLAWYYRHTKIQVEVNHIAKKAKDLMEKDAPQDFLEAEKQFKQALELDPKMAYSLSSLAQMNTLLWGQYGMADRKAEAEESVQKADALDPHLQERYAADSLILLYSGHPDQAAASAQAIIDRNAKGAAQVLDALGRAQRKMGKLDEARKAFTDASKAGWRNPRFNSDLGELYADMGDMLNAQTYFQKALEINADHPVSLIDRARANIAQGEKIKLATDDLASLLGPHKAELPPFLLAHAYTARAELKLFNKQPAEAAKDGDAAIKADPSYAPGYYVLGLSLVKSDMAKALTNLDRAIALDPYVVAFYFESAKALQDANQGDKAIAMLQRYEKAFPKDEHYYLLYGELLEKKGDLDGALAQYDLALTKNTFSAPAQFAKGRILYGQKKYPEAAKAFEAALEAQQNFPEAHVQLGLILLDSKKHVEAATEFEQALDSFKKNQMPKDKLTAMRDDFAAKLKKGGAPKPLMTQFADDTKEILSQP
jgi:tetratricopeptide (TPR) repeat protein